MKKEGKPISVKEAKHILRQKQLRQPGRRQSRFHFETGVENTIRLGALKGICGRCDQILPEKITCLDESEGIKLRCQAGYSPFELHQDRIYLSVELLAEPPNCPGYHQEIRKAAA